MQGPPGKQPLAERGYPVEIKVNNNNDISDNGKTYNIKWIRCDKVNIMVHLLITILECFSSV